VAARPLREQLILATLVMLLPLATMLAWAGNVTYRKQVAQVAIEATAMATLVAAHIDESKPAGTAEINPFLERLRFPDPGDQHHRHGSIARRETRRAQERRAGLRRRTGHWHRRGDRTALEGRRRHSSVAGVVAD
jgi:hypothetical protein